MSSDAPKITDSTSDSPDTAALKARLKAAVAQFDAERNRPEHEKSRLFPFLEEIRHLRTDLKATYPEILSILETAGLTGISEPQLAAFCKSAKMTQRAKRAPRRSGAKN